MCVAAAALGLQIVDVARQHRFHHVGRKAKLNGIVLIETAPVDMLANKLKEFRIDMPSPQLFAARLQILANRFKYSVIGVRVWDINFGSKLPRVVLKGFCSRANHSLSPNAVIFATNL